MQLVKSPEKGTRGDNQGWVGEYDDEYVRHESGAHSIIKRKHLA